MSKIEVGLRVAALTTLRDMIDTQLEEARSEMREQLVNLSEQYGVKSIEVKAEGEAVASATLTDGKPKILTLNETALFNWVEESFPNLVQTRRFIDPQHLTALFDEMIIEDDAVIHPATGEVLPFLGVSQRKQTLMVRFKPDGRNKVAAMFGNGSANFIDYIEEPKSIEGSN